MREKESHTLMTMGTRVGWRHWARNCFATIGSRVTSVRLSTSVKGRRSETGGRTLGICLHGLADAYDHGRCNGALRYEKWVDGDGHLPMLMVLSLQRLEQKSVILPLAKDLGHVAQLGVSPRQFLRLAQLARRSTSGISRRPHSARLRWTHMALALANTYMPDGETDRRCALPQYSLGSPVGPTNASFWHAGSLQREGTVGAGDARGLARFSLPSRKALLHRRPQKSCSESNAYGELAERQRGKSYAYLCHLEYRPGGLHSVCRA